MKFKFLLIFLVTLFLSCEKQEIDISNGSNEIDLYNLQVGQVSRYQFFLDWPPYGQDSSFLNLGDTLVVEVLGKDTNGQGNTRFEISETLTSGSNVFDPRNTYFGIFGDTSVVNYWTVMEDAGVTTILLEPLKYPEMFSLFLPLPRQREIRINLGKYQGEEVQIAEYDFSFMGGYSCFDCYTTNFDLNGVNYDSLNIYFGEAQCCDSRNTAMFFSEKHGIVRTFIYNTGWATHLYHGWDRIN